MANRENRGQFPVGRSDIGAARAGVLSHGSVLITAVRGPPPLTTLAFLFVFLQTHPDVTHRRTRSVVFERWKVETDASKYEKIVNFFTKTSSLFVTSNEDDEMGKAIC